MSLFSFPDPSHVFLDFILLGFVNSRFSLPFFKSMNLPLWDITVEFLCQVMLLWWLKKCLVDNREKCYVGQNKARKKPHSIAHIPPHSVGLSATQMMSYLGHCIGHQHLWRGTYLNCKIGWACWPQNFYIGPGSSVFSHSARSEATPSPSLISQ